MREIYKRGFTAGIVLLVLGFVLNWLVGILSPGVAAEYQNTAIFRPWDDPPMTFYFAYPFILGVALSYLWGKLKIKDPLEFARLYFIVATIPGMFITWTSFQLTPLMILVWMLTGFIQAYVAAWVFTKVK